MKKQFILCLFCFMINYKSKLVIGRMNVMNELEMNKYKKYQKQTSKGFINNLLTSIKIKIRSGEWI